MQQGDLHSGPRSDQGKDRNADLPTEIECALHRDRVDHPHRCVQNDHQHRADRQCPASAPRVASFAAAWPEPQAAPDEAAGRGGGDRAGDSVGDRVLEHAAGTLMLDQSFGELWRQNGGGCRRGIPQRAEGAHDETVQRFAHRDAEQSGE